jgi:2-hydroxychromene-2-carboxylate isomerase
MSATAGAGIRFYFSFRSPYSWLLHHRLQATGAIPWRDLDPVPIYPPDAETVARIAGGRTRLSYLGEDAERIARAYGLAVRWPEALDTDWARPHTAFLWARSEGRGQGFAGALFAARFQRGADIGTDEELRAAAAAAGLDADGTVAAADHPDWRERLAAGFARMQEDRVFGVPTFVLDGERFWGNDRLEWVLRRLAERRGDRVPDLAAEPLGRPFG